MYSPVYNEQKLQCTVKFTMYGNKKQDHRTILYCSHHGVTVHNDYNYPNEDVKPLAHSRYDVRHVVHFGPIELIK